MKYVCPHCKENTKILISKRVYSAKISRYFCKIECFVEFRKENPDYETTFKKERIKYMAKLRKQAKEVRPL